MTDIKRSQVGQKHVLIAVKQLGLGIKVFFFKSFKVFNYTTWKMHLRLLNVGIRMDHSICDLHLRSIVRSIVFFFEWHISLHNFQYRKYFLLLSPFPWNVSFHCPLENCILQRHLWSKFRPQSLANWSVALRRARDLHLNCFWPAPSSATCNRILRESPCLFALAPRRFWTRKKIVYNKHSIHT